MNAWKMPFNEGDYVLFYESDEASHLDFVIVSSADPSGQVSFIVKRYDYFNNLLLSKSNDTTKDYAPIRRDEDHKIRGIVIAIAKPVESGLL